MKLLSLILLIAAAAMVALIVLKRRGVIGAVTDAWPYYAKRPLSQSEQVLYHRLVKALPEHIVLAQVQPPRVLGVRRGFNFHQWNNRINRLSYDFVVCAKDSTVLAAIELDDKSHESRSRAETDARKEKATNAAGVHLIRWRVNSLPDQAVIEAAFAERQANLSVETNVRKGGMRGSL
jgi:very-short-patch-repair endonuclease